MLYMSVYYIHMHIGTTYIYIYTRVHSGLCVISSVCRSTEDNMANVYVGWCVNVYQAAVMRQSGEGWWKASAGLLLGTADSSSAHPSPRETVPFTSREGAPWRVS